MKLAPILFRLVLISAALAAATFGAGEMDWIPEDTRDFTGIAIAFFMLLTTSSLVLVKRALQRGRPVYFVNAVVLNFIIRLVATAVVMIVLAISQKPPLVSLLIPFAACYVFFTVLEAYWLMRLNKSAVNPVS